MQYETGAFSPYGDELLPLAQYLASRPNLLLDPDNWTLHLGGYYASYRQGQYKNKSAKHMEAAVRAGRRWPLTGDAADSQANAIVKVGVVNLGFRVRV